MNLTKTYAVLDCIFYDDGTSTSKDSYWTTTNTTLDRQATGTVLTKTNTTNNLNIRTSITAPCIIETEILQVDGATTGFFITFNKDTTQLTGTSVSRVGGALNSWIPLKMEVTSNNVRVTNIDTGNYEDRPMTDVPNQFRFRTSGDTTTIQFRNFKVYPL